MEPDKVVQPDQAHYIGVDACATGERGYVCNTSGTAIGDVAAGEPFFEPANVSGTTGVAPVPGTKMAFQDEFAIGVQHEFDHGIVVGGRYIDRRLKRATEDSNAITMEQAVAGLFNIPFILINPSADGDFFVNPVFVNDPGGIVGTLADPDGIPGSGDEAAPPADTCFSGSLNTFTDDGGTAMDTSDDVVTSAFCWTPTSGDAGPDGLPDGLPDPTRNYQAVEITFERRLRDNWQFHANWRIASLKGNYEGSFRNDNGQTDPSITSLFDFTDSPAALALYEVGPLPNDRTHVVNAYGSYMINQGAASGLNLGFGTRITSGKPLTELLAHPLFANAGEVPCLVGNLDVRGFGSGGAGTGGQFFQTGCDSDGRGGFNRTDTVGTVDLHADYPIRLGERFRLRGSIDFFNVFNTQRAITRREFREVTTGQEDPDFNTPSRLERPFNVRFAVRVEW